MVDTASSIAANERLRLNADSLTSSQRSVATLFNTLLRVTFNNTNDVLINMHNVVSNILWYRVISWFYMGISIASICVGAIYMDLCTVQYRIPLYLIVAGSVGLTTNLLFLLKWATNSWGTWTTCTPASEGNKSFWFTWTLWLLFWFNFAWFICGSVWIFGVASRYRHNFVYHADSHLYVVRHYTTNPRYLQPYMAKMHINVKNTSAKTHTNGKNTVGTGATVNKDLDLLVDADRGSNAHSSHLNHDSSRLRGQVESSHDMTNGRVSSEHRFLLDDEQVDGQGAGEADRDSTAMMESRDDIAGVDFARRSRGGHRARRVRARALPRHPFCHRGLFEYAFWVTIVQYILIVLDAFMFLSVLCCQCCAFSVIEYPAGAVPDTREESLPQ